MSRNMASKSYNPGNWALGESTHGPLRAPSPPQWAYRQRPEHRSPRRHAEIPPSRRLTKYRKDVQDPLQDSTCIVVPKNYSGPVTLGSSPPVLPYTHCQAIVVRDSHVIEDPLTSHKESSAYIRHGQHFVSRDDRDGGDKTWPSPPTRPQLRRLQTPELEPVADRVSFCACCPRSEAAYQMGRKKMDLQGRSTTSVDRRPSRVEDEVEVTKQC